MIGNLIKKTNGKKTTATAMVYVALKLLRIKYPHLLEGNDEIVEAIFTAVFSSTILHKLARKAIEIIRRKRKKDLTN